MGIFPYIYNYFYLYYITLVIFSLGIIKSYHITRVIYKLSIYISIMNLNLLLLNIYNVVNNYNSIVSAVIGILSLIVVINFTLYYLDNFNLSYIRIIKYVQIFSFVCIPLLILLYLLFVYDSMMLSSIVCNVADNYGDINNSVQGHVHVNGEQAGQSMAVTGAIGIGVYGATKALAKSSLPPLAKAGVLVAGGAAGVALNTIGNAVNTYTSRVNSANGSVSQSTVPKGTNQFMDLTDNYTPLEILMQCTLLLNLIAIYLIIFICLQLFYRYYVSDRPKLTWLESMFSVSTADKIRFFIYKIIKLNKSMSIYWVIYALILLIIVLSGSVYAEWELYNNLSGYIDDYLKYKK